MNLLQIGLFLFLLFKLSVVNAEELSNEELIKSDEVDFYVGVFDVIDKEGDDQAKLYGAEHIDETLYRDTFLGKFKPLSGAFITDDNAVYMYTGVEVEYGLGPITLSPSFAPGFYEEGQGKDLGSPLEFKSEIKLGLNIFENSKISYSYNHISNNDWGDINPGSNNEHITFSKQF